MKDRSELLIVEDTPDIAELLQHELEAEGYPVRVVDTGAKAFAELQTRLPALIILDYGLPDTDGIEVCKELRKSDRTRHIPVIFLTGRHDKNSIVLALATGADDYITKPFDPRELVGRVRAVLRRVSGIASGAPTAVGTVALDAGRHEITVGGKAVAFTRAEFRLLEALLEAPGRVRTRAELLERITGGDTVVSEGTLDVHVRAIRKKLGDAATLLVTVRGVGYKMDEKAS